MKRRYRKRRELLETRTKAWLILLVLISAVLLGSFGLERTALAAQLQRVQPVEARASSASEVIQLVNQLRKANSLPAYQVNNALMAAAQAHSEYQASIGNVTHTGAGGTRARDRAVAYGYGDGGTVYVSENIAGGNQLTAQKAVQWWQGDGLHLSTMLSPDYRDVGAGVAVSGNRVYFTLDVGYVGGSESPAAGQQVPVENLPTPTFGPSPTPSQTPIVIIPVEAATPESDGSIVHVVQQGQALWNIAAIYKINLPDLLELNGLNQNSLIHPGDELLIRAAQNSPTVAPTEEISTIQPSVAVDLGAAGQVTSTLRPTGIATVQIETPVALAAEKIPGSSDEVAAKREILDQPATFAEPQKPENSGAFLTVVAAFVVVGTALVLLGGFFKRVA